MTISFLPWPLLAATYLVAVPGWRHRHDSTLPGSLWWLLPQESTEEAADVAPALPKSTSEICASAPPLYPTVKILEERPVCLRGRLLSYDGKRRGSSVALDISLCEEDSD